MRPCARRVGSTALVRRRAFNTVPMILQTRPTQFPFPTGPTDQCRTPRRRGGKGSEYRLRVGPRRCPDPYGPAQTTPNSALRLVRRGRGCRVGISDATDCDTGAECHRGRAKGWRTRDRVLRTNRLEIRVDRAYPRAPSWRSARYSSDLGSILLVYIFLNLMKKVITGIQNLARDLKPL